VAEFLPQNAVFLAEVNYRVLLMPVHPAGNGHQENAPWCPSHKGEDYSGVIAPCRDGNAAHGIVAPDNIAEQSALIE
jgi:hypothetical protein